MSLSVFVIVMAAAAMHAGWNALIKGASDTLVLAVAICIAASVMAALSLPFVPQPAPESWPFIGLSVALQTVYYLLVAAAYDRADMSLAYPVMRGAAPMIVAVVSASLLSEHLTPMAWAGVALISGGILSLAALARSRRGLGFAALNALVIAAYTLSDGHGVRLSGAAVGYTLWIFLLTAPPVVAVSALRRGPGLVAACVAEWRRATLGGIGTMLSYGAALWAMTTAPVAMVAALRETSILFATLISVLILHETVGRARWVAVGLVALGAGALRLG